MALDPRIALAGEQVAPVDPNEEAVKAGQASDALALARQRIQSRQDDAAFATAMQQAGGDPDKAITLLHSTNPRAALTYGSMITKQRQDNLKLAADQSDFLGKQTDAALKLFQGVGNDPKQYQIALRGAFGILHDTPAGDQLAALPQNPTPDEIPGLVEGILQKGMSAKDYHEQITSGLKTWLGGDPVAGLAHMLEVTDDPQMRQSIIQSAKAHGAPDAFVTAATALSNQVAAGADPKTFRQLLGPQNPIKLGANETLIDPVTQKPIFTAPPPAATPYQVDSLAERTRHDKAMEAKPTGAVAPGAQESDPKDIADAIARGEQPPTLTGLYRNAAPVRAELARQGYPLAKATEDWTATQKYLGTLNGQQQVRLRQAIGFTSSSLDLVEDLAKQWDAGGFPVLNAAQLALAKNGALGPKAQQIATKLSAQVADLTSELGTVYKGGNSSTDESLKLAAQNLSTNWSRDTLLENINQIRKNLAIRQNSMKLAGVAGVNEGNPYTPPSNTQPHATPVPKNPVKGQIWQSPTGPVTWNGLRWVSGG